MPLPKLSTQKSQAEASKRQQQRQGWEYLTVRVRDGGSVLSSLQQEGE